MLVLLDSDPVKQIEIVVAPLPVDVEALRGRIDLHGVEGIAVLRPDGAGRKQVELEEVAPVQRQLGQDFAFNHGADFRCGLSEQRRSGGHGNLLGDLPDLQLHVLNQGCPDIQP